MSILQFIILLIILVLLAYFVGFSLISIIDNRLSKVSIQLPSQEHVIKLNNEHIEQFISSTPQKLNTENNDNNDDNNNQNNCNLSILQNKYDEVGLEGFDNYQKHQKDFIQLTNKDNDIRNKVCLKGDINNNDYGLTNYSHPNNMSNVDKTLFMSKYPPNLTLQDYVNWLLCFNKDNKNKLSYIHLKNLKLVNNGHKLEYEEGICPPKHEKGNLDNADYFEKLYVTNGINLSKMITDQEDEVLKGYNVGDYTEFI